MNARTHRMALTLAGLGLVLLAASSAQAEPPQKVDRAFKGQILISKEALPTPDPEDEAGTIKAYKSMTVKALEHSEVEGSAAWSFHFMAFMKEKPRSTALSLDFYTDDKQKQFVAQKRMAGADPSLQLLSSHVVISEDDGLSKGGRYEVRLTAQVGKKEVVLATAKISTK